MNKITCGICKDLMPLVKDGIACEDSRLAVEAHISGCEECKTLYTNSMQESSVNPDLEQEFGKLKKRVQSFLALLLVFGAFFGLSFTASEEMFYNSLIMPVIGILGYVIFQWNALWMIPMILLVIQTITNISGVMRGLEDITIMGVVMWVGIYSIFVALGVLVAGLLHFAFRKEK